MRRACLLGLFAICGALAGPKLYLKTRVIDPSDPAQVRVGKRRAEKESLGRVHLIAQYDHAPTILDVQSLALRGAVVLGYVHENGLMVSTDAPVALNDLGLLWKGKLEPADKISPLLVVNASDDSPRAMLVEFYADTGMSGARSLLLRTGAVLVDHPDLNP